MSRHALRNLRVKCWSAIFASRPRGAKTTALRAGLEAPDVCQISKHKRPPFRSSLSVGFNQFFLKTRES